MEPCLKECNDLNNHNFCVFWQAPSYTPVRALVDAVPKKGAPRYDFLRQLLKGMTSPSPAAAKYDPVWDLLHAAKEQGLPGVHLC